MENNVHTWFEVYSPDTESGKKFYADVFGWSSEDIDMGDFMYPMLKSGDKPFHAGMMSLKSPDMEGVPPHWLIYFHTADIDATLSKIDAAGGKTVHGPMDIPGVGRIAIVHDNGGAHFAVHQPAPMEG
ncbi:MAG: VOC family protein [Armatimonadetes bacterium]|nr:VOC family protein [Armatimonadota bacterium]